MSEFAKRVVFGLVAAPAFLACVWWGGWLYAVVILLIVWMMQAELICLLEAANAKGNTVWSLVAGAVVLLHPYNPLFLVTVFSLLLVLVPIEGLNADLQRQRRIMPSIFVGLYLPLMMSSLILLRGMGGDAKGFGFTVLLLLMVWGNDTFAYFAGRLFGKHAMAPTISPKKTWEGFAGGFIGAIAGLFLANAILPAESRFDVFLMWPLIPLLSIAGPIGDLVESRLKRHVNIKDSGSILPGHGGLLDRFDALHLCAPVMYIYLEALHWVDLYP